MSIFLSASSISDFIKCPQKVLYRFTKPFPEIQTREMIIGKVIHYALEKGWRERRKAIEIVQSQAKFNELTRNELTNLEFMVDMFFLNIRHRLGDEDLIEHQFKFNLYDDVFLVGKMDRISNGNLFDWKTASRISKNTGRDPQCIIYEYAYKRLFSRDPVSVNLVSLSKGEIVPYVRNDMYVNELFDKIIPRMIKTIRTESYERLGMFNQSCFRCPWKLGCLGGLEKNELDSTEFAE